MHTQLLYIHQLGVYYKFTNALALTQCLHTQLHCDSENQTRLHVQMTPTILLLGHKPWNSSWMKSGLVWSAADHCQRGNWCLRACVWVKRPWFEHLLELLTMMSLTNSLLTL